MRLLFVHAHPDDESILTGASIARYAAEGHEVRVITCTMGEQGEVIGAEFSRLVAEQADQLGGYRYLELAGALRALGVDGPTYLGGAGAHRDSGMVGTSSMEHPRAFARTDLHLLAAELALQIKGFLPHVVVTYGPDGGYGHPDHVRVHDITAPALELAAQDGWTVPKVYWVITPHRELAEGHARVQVAEHPFREVAELGFGVPDSDVTTVIDASAHLPAKIRALRSHATQVQVQGEVFALSNGIARAVTGVESYRLVQGTAVGSPETDLLAGLR